MNNLILRQIKLLLSLMAFCCTLSSTAQTGQTLQSLVAKRNFQDLQAFVDSAAAQSNRGIADIEWSLKRDVLPGYQEAVVRVHLSKGSADHRNFRVKILATETTIFYCETTGPDKEIDADQSFIDTQTYRRFEKSFLATYYAPLKKDDLFQNVTFGAGCGIAGTMPDHMLQLVFHLQNDDKDAVLSWLRSANTEKQLYALQGLKAMQLNGYDLTDEDRSVIKTIKKKKGKVLSCSGCLYGDESIGEAITGIESVPDEYFAYMNPPVKRSTYYIAAAMSVLLITLLLVFTHKRRKARSITPK